MWSFTDKGLKEAVAKSVSTFKSKDPKEQAHFESCKAALVAQISAVQTNGVSVNATGSATSEGSRATISISALKLTV